MIDDIGVNMQFIQYMGKILIEHIIFLRENKVSPFSLDKDIVSEEAKDGHGAAQRTGGARRQKQNFRCLFPLSADHSDKFQSSGRQFRSQIAYGSLRDAY